MVIVALEETWPHQLGADVEEENLLTTTFVRFGNRLSEGGIERGDIFEDE